MLAQEPRAAGKTEARGLQGIFRGHTAGRGWDQQQNKALSSRPVTSPLHHCRDTQGIGSQSGGRMGCQGSTGCSPGAGGGVCAHTGPCQSEASTPPSISLDRASTSAVVHRPEAGSTAPGRGQGAGERPYHHHSHPWASWDPATHGKPGIFSSSPCEDDDKRGVFLRQLLMGHRSARTTYREGGSVVPPTRFLPTALHHASWQLGAAGSRVGSYVWPLTAPTRAQTPPGNGTGGGTSSSRMQGTGPGWDTGTWLLSLTSGLGFLM